MPVRPALLALACTALSTPFAAFAQVAPQPPPAGAPRVLRVSGEGTVRVTPDVAVLVAGLEATGPNLARVTRDAATRMQKVHSALADAGVAAKDIQTTRHDVQVERPWKDDRPGPITGYTVSDEVRVTVRDLERLGPAIDKVTAAGGNAIRGLTFQKEDTTPERAKALAAAYASARVKAEALAKAAGVTLGEILQVGESAPMGPIPLQLGYAARAEAMSASATPVAPGQIEVGATVDVVYAIR